LSTPCSHSSHGPCQAWNIIHHQTTSSSHPQQCTDSPWQEEQLHHTKLLIAAKEARKEHAGLPME